MRPRPTIPLVLGDSILSSGAFIRQSQVATMSHTEVAKGYILER